MAGPTNQLDWGKLISMYGDSDAASAASRARQQQTEAAAQREAINKLMGQVEGSVYANVPQGVAGDVTKAPGYSDLLEGFNQNEARKYASNVEKAAWETTLRPDAQAPAGGDPWDSVKQRLDSMQGAANKQAAWNQGQREWQEDQRGREMDDYTAGGGFRKAWDEWVKGGGSAPGMDGARLTSNMQRAQDAWRQAHGGSLEGWYQSLPGAYYTRLMGGYIPQGGYVPRESYSGGFGAKQPDFNPNATNDADARDDETSY